MRFVIIRGSRTVLNADPFLRKWDAAHVWWSVAKRVVVTYASDVASHNIAVFALLRESTRYVDADFIVSRGGTDRIFISGSILAERRVYLVVVFGDNWRR